MPFMGGGWQRYKNGRAFLKRGKGTLQTLDPWGNVHGIGLSAWGKAVGTTPPAAPSTMLWAHAGLQGPGDVRYRGFPGFRNPQGPWGRPREDDRVRNLCRSLLPHSWSGTLCALAGQQSPLLPPGYPQKHAKKKVFGKSEEKRCWTDSLQVSNDLVPQSGNVGLR